jgi:hypothetical protein
VATTPADVARQRALQNYVVFRVKAIEFLDILALYSQLRATPMSQDQLFAAKKTVPQGLAPLVGFLAFRPPKFSADSLKTVALSWFALFIDKNGMDVIDLWCEVFPKHATKTRAAWRRMEPAWQLLRDFRNQVGFHADSPIRFFGARYKVLKDWPIVEAALKEFETLFNFFLKAEATELSAELEPALDSLLDELERLHGGAKFQREQFKSYLMLADLKAAEGPTV